MKMAALALIFLCCTGVGLFCALRVTRRIDLIRACSSALHSLSVDAAAARMPADSLLAKHFGPILGEQERGKMKNRVAYICEGEECMLLLEFLEEFGSGGLATEQTRCEITRERLSAILNRDEEDSRKKRRLFLSGGVIAGIFFGILAL